MPAPAAAHAFVVDLAAPELDPDDDHHLRRVLRLRAGDTVTVSDGQGRWRLCRLGAADLVVDGDTHVEPAPSPPITVAFAPVKGDRPEWAVQKLTELGVDHIVPLRTTRSVVRWTGERGDRQVARLRLVARAAAMQSRRVWLPRVSPVADLTHDPSPTAAGVRLALAHPGGRPPALDHPALAVGPEGGWAPEELVGAEEVGLGPTVLRAETAAVVAGTLLCALRSGTVGEGGKGGRPPVATPTTAEGERENQHG